jgi:hypothetical protein
MPPPGPSGSRSHFRIVSSRTHCRRQNRGLTRFMRFYYEFDDQFALRLDWLVQVVRGATRARGVELDSSRTHCRRQNRGLTRFMRCRRSRVELDPSRASRSSRSWRWHRATRAGSRDVAEPVRGVWRAGDRRG